ncbi:ChaC-like protein-domain-containing protein [Fimicolochytrium jonesii]|uniref:ChaC-like protein-domain-containing protein n=1 Tax=Fimicolochytrium jonesii TaxID=1396493 RepID=UPI0022FE47E0|nr:ChaC-like protein-domain-containing protein [Fimicolochytrium jonesii]KAI8825775.1 ChaC-like protein-domain-containing protein [Fimicolochytrium jonesii]
MGEDDIGTRWVFGYGSLCWKVDFPYEARFPGFVKGFVRRFWQGSTDHRGTPEAPGRVVTLVPFDEWERCYKGHDPHGPKHVDDAVCWGVAYKIAADKVEEVLAHLDHREKDGYDCVTTHVYHPTVTDKETGNPRPVVKARVYIATSNNDSFLGPTEVEKLALQIAVTEGPSGHNAEYFLGLSRSMRILAPETPDMHLNALEPLVIEHLKRLGTPIPPINPGDEAKFMELNSHLHILSELLLVDENKLAEEN